MEAPRANRSSRRGAAYQTDTRTCSVDLPEIAPPRDLRDIAALVLTLAGAKRLLARAQQVVPVYTP
ncbi:MAG: hypothetical protein JOY63_12800 [Acetobacteraceae bacterium]|nr:hypothetical protein [Acetobacteraceae bacterium]